MTAQFDGGQISSAPKTPSKTIAGKSFVLGTQPPIGTSSTISPAGKRIIDVSGQRDALLRDTWKAISNLNARKYFDKGGSLVLVEDGLGSKSLVLPTPDEWQHELAELFDWMDGEKHSAPPGWLAKRMLHPKKSGLPELDLLTTVPVLSKTGAIVQEPGFNRHHRVFYTPDPALAACNIPLKPSKKEISTARELLFEMLFGEFSFSTEADGAHAMAALLTSFVRPLLTQDLIPGFLVHASNPGAGKTTLCNLINVVVFGLQCDVMTMPPSEVELKKLLFSAIRMGKPILLFDNLPSERTLDSATLAGLLTAKTYQDRQLGTSKMVTLTNDSMLMFTGNNPRLTPELLRRVIPIKLESTVNWNSKTFERSDPVQWAVGQRAELIVAALTLVQAWVDKGRPQPKSSSLPSYGKWCEVIGGILEVSGVYGFLQGLDDFYGESNVVEQEFEKLLDVWHRRHGDSSLRTADIVALCEENRLMKLLLGTGSERSRATKLGSFLKERVGNVRNIWTITATTKGASNLYKLVQR